MIRNAIRTIAFPILLWLLPNGSVLAQATSSIKCSDGGTYTVSTGTNQGHCVGSKDVVACEDGKGNKGRQVASTAAETPMGLQHAWPPKERAQATLHERKLASPRRQRE